MNNAQATAEAPSGANRVETKDLHNDRTAVRSQAAPARPLVSLVLPVYNEAATIVANLRRLCSYMQTLEERYRWELVLVDDGSTDQSGALVDAYARRHPRVRVFHHITNFGAGQAFKYAFRQCCGEYVLTLDADLSYDVAHIPALLAKIVETRAKVVVASPYMRGGHVSNVPWTRKALSVCANRFLAATSESRLSTLTSMARVYDGRFLRSLNLRGSGLDILPEIIYKARLLGARVEEIPAHLDWGPLQASRRRRTSSARLWRHMLRVVLSGFLFRPVIFFILPGLAMLVFAAYVNAWVLHHFLLQFGKLGEYPLFFERASAAVAAAFAGSPHTFIVGISSLMLAIQLLSLGVLALQSRNYFEELFHLASAILRARNEMRDGGQQAAENAP
jgi:glycosyltransferase involved in cell wall biosynthesis